MAAAEEELGKSGQTAYVIPEGGSNGLGALGYADAMREVRAQLDLGLGGGPAGFDAVVHACGSGGTAAGIALGARRFEVAPLVHAIAVCDDRSYFEATIGRIVLEATGSNPASSTRRKSSCTMHGRARHTRCRATSSSASSWTSRARPG